VLDLHDHGQVRKTFASLERIDHLVLCGSSDVAWGPFESLSMEGLEKALRMKLVGYLHAVQSALLLLDEHSSITFVGGTASRAAMPGTVGLAAVNGGLEAATRTLARELAPRRVNLVSPGLTATEAYAAMPEQARTELFEGAAARLPVGKVGAPEEIADAIRFVMLNGFTTGSIVDVDGGAHLGYGAPLVN
jgi:NAD(P)-dependent dehydrogenase (short-subunit alcohol dehydrogenase family)